MTGQRHSSPLDIAKSNGFYLLLLVYQTLSLTVQIYINLPLMLHFSNSLAFIFQNHNWSLAYKKLTPAT
jgi:hypothetical protein